MVNCSGHRVVGSFFSGSADATRCAARSLGEMCEGGEVVLLEGDLGAGKTCFAQGLARGLGVDGAMRVTSPTFTLHAEYPGRLVFNHVDLYRLEEGDELDNVGVLDMLYEPGTALAVEWPELVLGHVQGESILVQLEHAAGDGRKATAWAAGTRHTALAEAWLGRVERSEIARIG